MKTVESYNQCNLLIKDFRREHGKVATNFYFLPNELKDIIERREMKYWQNKEALLFYVEETDFSHIFYFVNIIFDIYVLCSIKLYLFDFHETTHQFYEVFNKFLISYKLYPLCIFTIEVN